MYSFLVRISAETLFKTNSKEYWNYRMALDWSIAGGNNQTSLFATGLFAYVDRKQLGEVSSILDFGCGMGDSAPIINMFFPSAKIGLYDLSDVALDKGISKYSPHLPVVKHKAGNTYDLVYSSNVIEHVDDPKAFVEGLIKLSNKVIIIQCPWEEMHPDNGALISPENATYEHFWTINDDFMENNISCFDVDWSVIVGDVPIAWPKGKQAFFVGIKRD